MSNISIDNMTASQIWEAWKAQELTVDQVVTWQQRNRIYFDERGNTK